MPVNRREGGSRLTESVRTRVGGTPSNQPRTTGDTWKKTRGITDFSRTLGGLHLLYVPSTGTLFRGLERLRVKRTDTLRLLMPLEYFLNTRESLLYIYGLGTSLVV